MKKLILIFALIVGASSILAADAANDVLLNQRNGANDDNVQQNVSATANALFAFNGSLVPISTLTPTGLTSLGVNSITAASSTNLTLAGGTAGTSSVVVSNTTAATTTTSGALRVAGGVGVVGAMNVGGAVSVAGQIITNTGTAAAPIISLNGTANGLYYTGTNIVRIAAAGVEAATFAGSAANFTGTVTASGGLTASGTTANQFLVASANAGQIRALALQTGGVSRWLAYANTTAESGSNAGSNFQLAAYDDAGNAIDSPISISRVAGGTMTLSRPTTFAGAVSLSTAGTTISIKSGTNAAAGTVTLSGGAATITSTAIDVNTVIVMSIKTKSGSFDHAPSVVVAASSATIDGNNSDNSTYNWIALKVN
jgi:hypothetical protein